MKITCSTCKNSLEIPDERFPVGQVIAFPCPRCQEKMEIDRRNAQGNETSSDKKGSDTFLTGDALKKEIVASVQQLPPMPQTVLKAREIMSDPDSDFKMLGRLLELDQAMAAKVLSLANSSYYGLSGRVSSIQHASVVLGHKALAELITMGGTSRILGKKLEGYGLDSGQLWRHSLGVAFGSRIIANQKNPAMANDAFTSGLLHDSGKLILDPYVLERRKAFEDLIEEGPEDFLVTERKLLEFDHAEIAYDVCSSWNLPASLGKAIRYHHNPSQSDGDELSYIIHVADGVSLMAGLGLGIDGMMYQFEDGALERLGLQEDALGDIMAEMFESVQKISETATQQAA